MTDHSPFQVFDKAIDFLTEGYIEQLLNSTGVKCENINPHAFTFRLAKANGVVPVLSTNYLARYNSLFFGKLNVSLVTGAGIPDLSIVDRGVSFILNGPVTNQLHLFQSIVNPYNMASVNADVFQISIHFNGYLITTNG